MTKIIYWAPRVLTILFITFISIFALDVFSEGFSFTEIIIALFMHLIPSFALILILIIAWKWENIGGLIFLGLGVFYLIMTAGEENIWAYVFISGPAFLIGILFLMQKISKK